MCIRDRKGFHLRSRQPDSWLQLPETGQCLLHVREHQKDIKIKWMDKDNFSITLMVNGQEWYEEWTRVKRPDFFKKILKSTEL